MTSCLPSFPLEIFGIEFLCALGTKAVAELSFGMFADILLQLVPVPFVIPYLLTGSTDRQKPAQCLYFIESRFEFEHKSSLLLEALSEAGQQENDDEIKRHAQAQRP
jgi:hypothetical protein